MINNKNPLWISEEKKKDEVYKALEFERKKAKDGFDSKHRDIDRGSYEDQAAFMSYSSLTDSRKKWHTVEALTKKLYSNPYFSHISALLNGNKEDYFLSDNENLETPMIIGDNGYLLPFKQDSERPFLSQIFHCYQSKHGEHFTTKSGDTIEPTLICDDKIQDGNLLSVILRYSEEDGTQSEFNVDELLVQKLRENRENPVLANIISTLQLSQFEIIQDDVNADFAVQGCAGSGKSQILLHRLFFLRDMLSTENWKKVLLITPSELFRNYSSELVRRYGLSNIRNTSIAELYKSFLDAFDSNFKNRQYSFEFTEEYLPDEYLYEVYENSNIQKIDTEIKNAIHNRISMACNLLGIDIQENYDFKFVEKLIDNISDKLKEIDSYGSNDEKYSDDNSIENIKHQLDTDINTVQTSIDELKIKYNDINDQIQGFDEIYKNFLEAKQERADWLIKRQDRIHSINKKLTKYQILDNSDLSYDVPGQYARLLFEYYDLRNGDAFVRDKEYSEFLNDYYNQADADLKSICKGKSPEQIKLLQNETLIYISEKLKKQQNKLRELNVEYENCILKETKINEKANQNETEIEKLRSKYVRARFFLYRLASNVFEKEVWNTLSSIKEKYDIKTFKNGTGNKRIRILYKSDLLFYLRIYAQLYPSDMLPEYDFICIDEGQDLHSVEYETLRELYPDARFNIFGDTAQVLHANCGIHNWQDDTCVKKVYYLNKNYRNNAAIVDFCNTRFNSDMKYIGDLESDSYPVIINSMQEILRLLNAENSTIIVKNKNIFYQFCNDIGLPETNFEFIDTNTTITTEKTKCYTIYAAKGLEFSRVIVYSKEMTKNQKVVACTRAMEKLYYCE